MSASAEQFLAYASQYAGDNGAAPDSPEALRYLNAARRLLWPQGDWEGTMLTGFVHLNEGCFFLAHPGEIIKAAYMGCTSNPIPILDGSSMWSTLTSLGLCCESNAKLPFFRTALTYPLPTAFPAGTQLGFAAKNVDDAGKKVTVVYDDINCGRVVEEVILEDLWKCVFQHKGVVNKVISITKEPTMGKVQVLSKHNGATSTIHEYSSEEVSPNYQQYQVTSCSESGHVVIRVKKKFIPINHLGEPIDLNENALEWAMQAIVSQEANDLAGYATKLKFAREHLQLETEDFTNSITPSREVPMGQMVIASTSQYHFI